jgi:hypothetical protein
MQPVCGPIVDLIDIRLRAVRGLTVGRWLPARRRHGVALATGARGLMGLMEAAAILAGTNEGVAKPGAICLSEDAYRQVQQRLDLKVSDLGRTALKNIA